MPNGHVKVVRRVKGDSDAANFTICPGNQIHHSSPTPMIRWQPAAPDARGARGRLSAVPGVALTSAGA
jgi:hypothetical protein